MGCDGQKFLGVLDLVGIGFFPGGGHKHLSHASAVVGMGGGAGSHHAGEVTGRNGIGGCAAESFAGIFTLDPVFGKREPAGSHCAVFAADALDTDVTWLHGHGPVENGFNTDLLGVGNHFLG